MEAQVESKILFRMTPWMGHCDFKSHVLLIADLRGSSLHGAYFSGDRLLVYVS